jgi:hypothetical protein
MKGAKAAKTAFWLGIGSTVIAALAAYGTGWGLWHFIPGLLGVVAAVLLALIAVIAGVIALVRKPVGLCSRSRAGRSTVGRAIRVSMRLRPTLPICRSSRRLLSEKTGSSG